MVEVNESVNRLRAVSRKQITLPESGAVFEIRRLWPRDFIDSISIASQIEIPAGPVTDGAGMEVADAKRARAEKLAANPAYVKAWYQVVLERGVISPRVILDDAVSPGDGEVNLWEIPERDLVYLVDQIIQWSGLGSEAEAIQFFRQAAPQNAGGN